MELYVGGDLSRKRLDWLAVWADGAECGQGAACPDRQGLTRFAGVLRPLAEEVVVVIESMTGARFVHDELEAHGLEVQIADARRARFAAELLQLSSGAKTDRLDARRLAELGRLGLVPEIWLADPETRQARELARFRLHLVRHRTMLKNRIHQTLITHGVARAESDLFGRAGRERLERLQLPQPWQGNVRVALALIDHLDEQISTLERQLRQTGADHPSLQLLLTAPGIGWVLGFTIASELGTIERFPSAGKLVGYTGLCPRVSQSGETDRRGPLTKKGPKWLRWALVEAAQNACRHPAYAARYQRTKQRLGRQRGPKVAQIELSRRLTETIWHMLTRNQPFAPAGAGFRLAA
jgi:transposase